MKDVRRLWIPISISLFVLAVLSVIWIPLAAVSWELQRSIVESHLNASVLNFVAGFPTYLEGMASIAQVVDIVIATLVGYTVVSFVSGRGGGIQAAGFGAILFLIVWGIFVLATIASVERYFILDPKLPSLEPVRTWIQEWLRQFLAIVAVVAGSTVAARKIAPAAGSIAGPE